MSRSLFGEMLIEAGEASRPEGPFASVVLENTLDKTLDYAIPPKLRSSVRSGQRVRVPLGRGNKPAFGWIVDIHETCDFPRIKSLIAIEDERTLVTPAMMELARWISRYYFCPLGTVLESVIPSAVKKRIGLGYLQIVRAAQSTDEIHAASGKNTGAHNSAQSSAGFLQLPLGEGIELHKLAEEAGTTLVVTVRKLVKAGIISTTTEAEWSDLDRPGSMPSPQKPILLNEDQQRVFDELIPRLHRR